MSFVTACPACATCFRVYPQQLATRQGKVRCGKCGEAFNALERLAEEELEEQARIAAEPQISKPEEKLSAYTYTLIDKTPEPEPAPTPVPVSVVVDTPAAIAFESLAPTPRRWQAPAMLLALALLACLQTLFYLRTPIAARWPVSLYCVEHSRPKNTCQPTRILRPAWRLPMKFASTSLCPRKTSPSAVIAPSLLMPRIRPNENHEP